MALKLNVIICSTRPGRVGKPVGEWFFEAAKGHAGFEVELVDLADMNLPIYDEPKHPRLQQYEHEHTKRWAASVDGADAFVFDTNPLLDEFDTIQDFTPGEDLIHLDANVFQLWDLQGGALTDEVFVAGSAATATLDTHRLIYDTDTSSLYYDEDGKKGGHDAIHFATLSNKAVLDHEDFVIV